MDKDSWTLRKLQQVENNLSEIYRIESENLILYKIELESVSDFENKCLDLIRKPYFPNYWTYQTPDSQKIRTKFTAQDTLNSAKSEIQFNQRYRRQLRRQFGYQLNSHTKSYLSEKNDKYPWESEYEFKQFKQNPNYYIDLEREHLKSHNNLYSDPNYTKKYKIALSKPYKSSKSNQIKPQMTTNGKVDPWQGSLIKNLRVGFD